MAITTLTETLAADGDSAEIQWSGQTLGNFSAEGTFGGGTAKLQWSQDGGTTWKDVDTVDLAFTEIGAGNFFLPACKLRINLAGATAPSVTARIMPVEAQSI